MLLNYKAMRKNCIITMFLTLVLSLTACGNVANSSQTTPSSASSVLPPTSAPTEETPSVDTYPAVDAPPDTDTDGGNESGSNILIAYFAVAESSEVDAISSASVLPDGRGFIRVLADHIHESTGGDYSPILTSVDYPANIGDLIDYAAKEQEANERPELTSHIENLDGYDTIFIGFPNWWYDMPMVMYSFFDEYDFSGKTIVPFCTHNGSGFSQTIKTIQDLEPDATVLDGFTTNFANVEDVSDEIVEWVSGLAI